MLAASLQRGDPHRSDEDVLIWLAASQKIFRTCDEPHQHPAGQNIAYSTLFLEINNLKKSYINSMGSSLFSHFKLSC